MCESKGSEPRRSCEMTLTAIGSKHFDVFEGKSFQRRRGWCNPKQQLKPIKWRLSLWVVGLTLWTFKWGFGLVFDQDDGLGRVKKKPGQNSWREGCNHHCLNHHLLQFSLFFYAFIYFQGCHASLVSFPR